RLLDHAERQAAGVDQAVAQRDRKHHAQAMLAILPVDDVLVGELGLVSAGCEKCQPSTRHADPPSRSAGAGSGGLVAASLFHFNIYWKNHSNSWQAPVVGAFDLARCANFVQRERIGESRRHKVGITKLCSTASPPLGQRWVTVLVRV